MAQPEIHPEHSFNLALFADYFQLYLRDAETEQGTPDDWGKNLEEEWIAVDIGIIGIGTARNTRVPVQVQLLTDQPTDDDFTEWDHVAEASIDVPSGQLIIAGCTDYLPDAQHIPLKPGIYRVRVYYGGLDTLRENDLRGDDHYRVVLWPDGDVLPKVLKRWRQ